MSQRVAEGVGVVNDGDWFRGSLRGSLRGGGGQADGGEGEEDGDLWKRERKYRRGVDRGFKLRTKLALSSS